MLVLFALSFVSTVLALVVVKVAGRADDWEEAQERPSPNRSRP